MSTKSFFCGSAFQPGEQEEFAGSSVWRLGRVGQESLRTSQKLSAVCGGNLSVVEKPLAEI